MKFNILTAILNVVQVIESVMAKKTGKEKLEASVDAASPIIAELEGVFEKDLLKQENVRPAYDQFVAAAIALRKAVDAAKAVKA